MASGEVTREFTTMRVALAQVNTTVGDLTANTALVLSSVEKLADQGVHMHSFLR